MASSSNPGQAFSYRDLARDPTAERMFTLEIWAWDPVANARKDLYFATHPFASGPMDLPANQIYEPRLSNKFSVKRALFAPGVLSGRSEPGVGSLTLVNEDGALDYMANLVVAGRAVRVAMQGVGWDGMYSGMVFQGTCDGIDFTEDTITIRLRDRMHLLDKELQTLRFTTTTNLGNTEVLNKLRPRTYGYVRNIEPVYVGLNADGKPTYHYHDAVPSWTKAVYDRGVPLTPTHVAIPAAGQFRRINNGQIVLAAEPAGTLTADVYRFVSSAQSLTNFTLPFTIGSSYTFELQSEIDAPKGALLQIHPRTYGNWYLNWYDAEVTAVSDPGVIPQTVTVKILEGSSQAAATAPVAVADWTIYVVGHPAALIVDLAMDCGAEVADTIDPLSWGTRQQYSAKFPATAGIWLPEGGNAMQILDYIASGSGFWYGFLREGTFDYGITDRPEVQTYTAAEYTVNEIIRLERLATDDPVWNTTVKDSRNWTPMRPRDLAGGVTQAVRQFVLEEWRNANVQNAALKTAWPTARDLEVLSVFADKNHGLTAHLRDLLQVKRDYFRVTVKTVGVLTDIGQSVKVTFPRWGLDAGRNFLVIDIEDNYDTNEVILGLWG